MNPNEDFGLRVAGWLRDEGEPVHAGYLGDVLAATRGARQRPAWSSLERWLPMDLTFPTRRLPVLPSLRLLITVGLIVILAALAIIAVGSRQQRLPAPFGPAANGSILSDSANGDINVSAADGTNTRPLITGPTVDHGPWFSHDGTRFVFAREAGPDVTIMLARADGSDVRQLTPQLGGMDWYEFSPDDKRLVVVHTVDGRQTLSVLDIDTQAMRDLPIPDLQVMYLVLWRPPNGDELYFTARPSRFALSQAGLYAIRPDGTGFREVLPPRPDQAQYQNLDVSADGAQLAYWQYEQDAVAARSHAYVHLLDLRTGVDRRMTFDPTNDDESLLKFSPDGRTAAIIVATGGRIRLQLVDLTGAAAPRHVGPDLPSTDNLGFGFSPDGKQVVIAFDNAAPTFIDVPTGRVTIGPTVWQVFSSWQRLAP
jgi:dipeptidyl aminopeptidase/acylaminoacyl peptidase